MKKTAVIYWSGTGNTEAMAEAVLAGMKDGGADAVILTPDQVDAASVGKYDAIAFGCPAMGSEMLEESEFEPMFSSVKGSLGGKKIALFGSYGWGDDAQLGARLPQLRYPARVRQRDLQRSARQRRACVLQGHGQAAR